MTGICIIGVGMTRFGRHRDKSLKQLSCEAVDAALIDAGLQRNQIEEIHFANCVQGYMDGQHMIRGHAIFLEQGFQGIPIFNLESGCASGSMAFHQAVRCLLSGQADVVMAVGAEKMVCDDKGKMFNAFTSAWDIARTDWQMNIIEQMAAGPIPSGSQSDKPYSPFMDVYKAEFIQHQKLYDSTVRQVAAICAKNHLHSTHNPNAQFQQAYSIDEVLNAAPITYPLTLPMCAPISDGAAAVILCKLDKAPKLGAGSRAIPVLASTTGSGRERAPEQLDQHLVTRIADKAYEMAGVAAADVDVAELHDATAVGELLETENLRLCPPGTGGEFAERGYTSLGGSMPVNVSGGLESRGHPIAATGIAQIFDLVQQLRGEAGARQVEGARIGLQCNVGGFWGVEEASAHVAILGSKKAI
ncbi:MAG: thiolase family protein [Ketobacter sp.]|nr:thiolase family protein [Ketobacter sp.]